MARVGLNQAKEKPVNRQQNIPEQSTSPLDALIPTREETERVQKKLQIINGMENPIEEEIVVKKVKKPEPKRCTFLLTPFAKKALELHTAELDYGLSEYILLLLEENIPRETWNKAANIIAEKELRKNER